MSISTEGGKPRNLLRYAAMLGTVGAVVQVGYGVRELRDAVDTRQRINGAIDIGTGLTRGTAATVTFGAAIAATMHYANVVHAVNVAAAFQLPAFLMDGCRDLYNGDRKSGSLKLASAALVTGGLVSGNFPCLATGYLLCDTVTLIQNRSSIKGALQDGWRKLAGHF